ncbi:MAG: class I SAM-dependent methyltransferase [Candidatus Peribacteraceae bacterium]|nr:class I SAM-dependent methyltransferase [Candidatus Peribacteraceae bacterium]
MHSYALLDFGHGERLEQWGEFRLIRPDPTADGNPMAPELWTSADATYDGEKGKGEWHKAKPVLEQWPVAFDDLQMTIKLAPYKHTGVFPEQQKNWNWMRNQAKKIGRPLTILNLFAYTGGATMALAKDGHKVTHVDASKPAIGWAKENAQLNNLAPDAVRWILEDAPLFAQRELKRGKQYDAIILDPPAFGHSPTGKTWRVERDLKPLLEDCITLLSDSPSFIVLNGYAKNDTPDSFHRLLSGILHTKKPSLKFVVEASELFLMAQDGRRLSTGIVGRCSF